MKWLKIIALVYAFQSVAGMVLGAGLGAWVMWGCAGDISCAIQEMQTWLPI